MIIIKFTEIARIDSVRHYSFHSLRVIQQQDICSIKMNIHYNIIVLYFEIMERNLLRNS